jgi:carbon-monoxide dehydrogenase large subunit
VRYIGTRVARREDAELLTGAARTVADLRPADLPPHGDAGSGAGIVEVAFVRSPVAHAEIRGVDTGAARRLDGVIGAWSAAELPELPNDRVRYGGEAVAVVAAGSRAVAEDGAELVELDLVELPPLVDPAVALAPGAPRLHGGGDNVALEKDFGAPADEVSELINAAPVVIEAAYREQLLLPTSLEPRAILVVPGPRSDSPNITVYVSHQAQHRLRGALAGALGWDEERVRVVVPATGGAFGAKSQTYPEYLVAVRLAVLLGRPVRWCEDRAEALVAATRGRGQYQRVRLAADEDGTFVAYELMVDADVGGHPETGAFVPTMTGEMASGAYRTPHVHAHVRSVLTTTPPTSAYRGAGRPEAAYALERTVDQLARRLDIDPAELRRRNFVRPEQFPYRTPTGRLYDSGDYAAALDTALAELGYDELRAEQERRRRDGGPPLGIGLATYVERSGGAEGTDEYGAVEACPDGTFVATVGSTPTGQGHLTAFAQVAASALDVDLELVRVVAADTAVVPYGFGTFGSRSMQVGGTALWHAATRLVDEGRRRCAADRGVPVEDVHWKDGALRLGTETVTLAELARVAPLKEEERWASPQAFPFGAYAAAVEVEPELGTVTIRRLVAVDDYGVVVNPMLVDGQGYGSVAQGLGQALFEEAGYRPDGTARERTLLDYLIPTAADVPPVTLLETETPNPNTPIGGKGAGEAGCIGVPPAVVNAVCDALDVDHIDMPLTPENVWRAAHCGQQHGCC